jgi:hypothetical protein
MDEAQTEMVFSANSKNVKLHLKVYIEVCKRCGNQLEANMHHERHFFYNTVQQACEGENSLLSQILKIKGITEATLRTLDRYLIYNGWPLLEEKKVINAVRSFNTFLIEGKTLAADSDAIHEQILINIFDILRTQYRQQQQKQPLT